MWIRLVNKVEQREMLVNVNHISTFEVLYAVPSGSNDGMFWRTSLHTANEDPSTTRIYRLRLGEGKGDTMLLLANPDDPIAKIFGDIYKSAIG